MSHMVTRKGPVGDDKDKRQTDSPVKEMKKKIAANAEKEKLAAEKHDKATDKSEKAVEKSGDKKDKSAEKHAEKGTEKKDKSAEKQGEKPLEKKDKNAEKNAEKNVEKPVEKKDKSVDKSLEKSTEKKDKSVDKSLEKSTEKKDKSVDKSLEKPTDKKDKPSEKVSDKKEKADKKEVPDKTKEDVKAAEKSGKADKPEKAKLNGAAANGAASSSDDDELVIVEQPEDNDEMFPELAYDDNSDADGSEGGDAAARSLTRRSQVKATRTPETPRPVSAAPHQRDTDHSKEPKLLRLKEESDRWLRSSDSPKPPSEGEAPAAAPEAPGGGAPERQHALRAPELLVEVERLEEGEARRDTRFSRSRVKVSPYRRSARLQDNASHTSLLANYTGNNTTMEMDITESSMASEGGGSPPPSPSPDDSYLSALRAIRGRRSYKPAHAHAQPHARAHAAYVQAQAHAHAHAQAASAAASLSAATATAGREGAARPTGTVVGRKRRPDAEGGAEGGAVGAEGAGAEAPKRARLLERLARPFRAHSTPLPARRAAEIVGINTDLPLSAPVAAADSFDPETIKPTPTPTAGATPTPTLGAAPTPTPTADRDSKRCVVM
ncbi:unnamed protein product, partial [Iphiclides podalirius]